MLKTISWRVTESTTTMLIVYFFSSELKIAGSVAVVEIITKMIVYYLHEMARDGSFKSARVGKAEAGPVGERLEA